MNIRILCVVLFFVAFSMGMDGCDPTKPTPPPPKPTIVVESTESVENTGATILFKHHLHDQQSGKTWVYLPNPEAIKDYKTQLEFVLKRLEDVERRMNTHEESQEHSAAVP